jgi:hypothetical protein
MKKIFFSLLLLTFVGLSSVFASDPPVFDTANPNAIPIDGGASVLLAAGAAYGVKKVRAMRKKNTEESVEETN